MKTTVLAIAYGATVIAANAALQRWGLVALLGFGSLVPAGVYVAGLSFGIRDALHEVGGWRWTVAAIVLAAGISWFIAPSFAVASGVAFLLSELLDLAVYSPLRQRRWTAAVVCSNIVGSIADSLVFLWLAFGTLSGWGALTIGKVVMIVPALPIVAWARSRR